MTRLTIQDTRSGLYPFHYKHLTLLYNGEIYNAPQLRQQLVKIGILPISTIGLGLVIVSSLNLVPKPPAKITTFIIK